MFWFGNRKKGEEWSFVDDEFGEVRVKPNVRSRRLRIRALVDGLSVSAPVGTSEWSVKECIEEHRAQLRRMVANTRSRSVLLIDAEHPLRGLTFVTSFVGEASLKVFRFTLREGVLTVAYPSGMDLSTEQSQRLIKKGVEHYLRLEAKRVLPSRVAALAAKWGFEYDDVKIQSSNSRWGSCSTRRGSGHHINLSMYLLLVPEAELVDYVVLHELCHTVEMNHSARFWALMDRVTEGRSKALRSRLGRYRCAL